MKINTVYLAALAVVLHSTSTVANASSLADPTRPGNDAMFAPQHAFKSLHDGWVLNSTLIATDRRVAVINGEHVSEGETVDNARVLKIRKLDVDIQTPGKRITLKLLPDIVSILP